MRDLNPAVERALEAVGGEPTVSDWLRVLLADDEGRPAALVARLGFSSLVLLAQIPDRGVTLDRDEMLRTARDQSIRLIGDPTFTTDFMLIAALFHDPLIAEGLGLRLDQLEGAVRSPLIETAPSVVDESVTPFAGPDATDRGDAARIVDANLNRARESLRVLDDFARFVRNDAGLTGSVKILRHKLADLNAHLPLTTLLAARDTVRDVGTGLEVKSEYDRGSPTHVAAVNCKRLQESLRSVEEYGKVLSPFLAREIEAIRYEAYTLERALFGGGTLRERLQNARLYALLSGDACVASLDWTIAEAAAGGVQVFQLREKNLGDRELLARAIAMRDWTRKAKVLFVVNDRPDIARLSGADGVHLGQEDFAVADTRRILGPGPLIGVSTHNLDQVRRAVREGADYLGIGPCFPSTTKKIEHLAGLDFITAAVRETSLPAFALGGITAANIDQVLNAGATRIAVGAAIAGTDEPRMAAKQLRADLPD